MASVVVPMSIKSDEPSGILSRDLAGDALFLLELHHFTGAVGGIDGTRMQGGTAMMAPDLVLFGEIVQIPANGLGADVKVGHQIVGRDKSLPRQDVQDLQMSLGLLHACTPMMRQKKAPADAGPFGSLPDPLRDQ